MTFRRGFAVLLASAVLVPKIAAAQPAPQPTTTPPAPSAPTAPTTQPAVDAIPAEASTPLISPYVAATPPPPAAPAPEPQAPEKPRPDDPAVEYGLLFAPTARLLPAGVVSAALNLDTGGAFGSDLRVGLGDVAEFGVGTTDAIREISCLKCAATDVSNIGVAHFAMGLAEGRLSQYQPAIVLGFEKTFSNDDDNRTTRFANLYLAFTKKIGAFDAHLGVMLWDGSIVQDTSGTEVTLHDGSIGNMVRPYGGVEVQTTNHSKLLVELSWNPELQLQNATDSISLKPTLAFGVRYGLRGPVSFEAGVRAPDIGDAHLLDAQIFAQLRVTTFALAHLVESLQH